ncbi:hypothetical protein GQ457_12G006010 [Hibiscus cannabinus]
MGCVSSKQTGSVTPAFDHSGALRDNAGTSCSSGTNSDRYRLGFSDLDQKRSSGRKTKKKSGNRGGVSDLGSAFGLSGSELGESGRASSRSDSLSLRLGNLPKYIEGEHVAAGWPAWLSAVAGEAINGWVPLKADSYQKLEKIGQGTYSTVFRARDLDSGRIVALKKVRVDNFEPESVRFMAREILILRRLDHPNIIKLDGIITSPMSIYLVFEYMEHDITGLLSCPDIKFSESQIKCYMKQLLSGLHHCHSLSIMHRDIKGSNLLVNNEGILKIADFGLANFYRSGRRQLLTSRVVSLWYRPPELLLGSTDYTAAVDLWSVGCVFSELLLGKPILQGRTEVEQLHKIFKLCGSPPNDYWKKARLPRATIFKPQQPYDSSLRDTFKDLPDTAVNLIETLLSVEPYKRGTASSALASSYFTTKPYACDPSSLPVYPPSKEIDAKLREEARRKKISGRVRGPETRKPIRKSHSISKLAPVEDAAAQAQSSQKINVEEAAHIKHASQGDIPFSGPLQVSTSSGFAWAKRRKDRATKRSHSRSISRGHDSYEATKRAMQKQWSQFVHPDSLDASEGHHSQELSLALNQREEMTAKGNNLVCL